jgi:hypothetical protein
MRRNKCSLKEAVYDYIEKHAEEVKSCYVDKKTNELDKDWERKAFRKLSQKFGRYKRQI